MCEQTEVRYLDGDVVWVKLGSCWWPGSVKDVDQLPEEILVSLKKKPIAAVKFFQEETFEYVRNLNQICMYNCRKKNEFIKKGLDIYRTRRREGSSVMDKFPDDVAMAEKLTGGDPNILRDTAFEPEERPNYRSIFGAEKKTGSPEKKIKNSDTSNTNRISWKVRSLPSSANGRRSQALSPSLPVLQHPRQITHPRFTSEVKEESDHVVRIRHQSASTPSQNEQTPSPQYKCHLCDFTSSRLNVIVLHNKFHSADAANNGRSASAKETKAKQVTNKSRSAESKSAGKGKGRSSAYSPNEKSRARTKTVPASFETPKSSTAERNVPKRKLVEDSKKETTNQEYDAISKQPFPKSPEKQLKTPEKKSPKTPVSSKRKSSKWANERPTKKKKSDEQIREKLLADWEDEDAEEEEKEIELIKQELSKSEVISTPSPTAALTTKQSDNLADAQVSIMDTTASITDSVLSTTNSVVDVADTIVLSTNVSTIDTKSSLADTKVNIADKIRNTEENIKSKQISCFDFDDAEDANLGSELEERAKKFVENRKIPRIIDDKCETAVKRRNIVADIKPLNVAETKKEKEEPVKKEEPIVPLVLPVPVPDIIKKEEEIAAVDTEDMDTAFKTLLAETTVPALPDVPELPTNNIVTNVASPTPDVENIASQPDQPDVLDNNNSQSVAETDNPVLDNNNSQSVLEIDNPESILPDLTDIESGGGSSGDHDYSIKKELEDVQMKLEDNIVKSPEVEPQDITAHTSLEDDEMELDINSMPVVMTDAIITEEPESNKTFDTSMSLVNLVPSSAESHTLFLNENSVAGSPLMVTAVATIVTSSETSVLSKNSNVISSQVPCSSGGMILKATQSTPLKTVKLQAASVSASNSAVSGAAIPTISKLKSTAGAAAVISQKGPGGGKLVIVQTSPGPQSRYTVGKTQPRVAVKAAQQQIVQQGSKVVILTKPQSSGQQKILTTALSPQHQRILTAGGKLQAQPQLIMTSTGAILTPINPRSVMAKGTKFTPVSQQQMRVLQGGKQTVGPKFTMQSTQAKVILPSSMQKASVMQPSPVRVIHTLKPQSNTILIQTTQGTTVSETVVAKPAAATSAQIQPKITTAQSIAKLPTSKPKILASSGVGTSVQRISVPTVGGKACQSSQSHPTVLGIKQAVAPRVVVQKVHSPVSSKGGSVGVITNVPQLKKVSGIFPRQSSVQKINQPTSHSVQNVSSSQTIQKVIAPSQTVKKAVIQQKVCDVNTQSSKRIPVVVSATNLHSNAEILTTQALPTLQPLQPNITIGPTIQQNLQPNTMVLSTSQSIITPTTIPVGQCNTVSIPAVQPASVTTTAGTSVLAPQIAQVVAATPTEQLGDTGTATYVLVTIDESGALQQYDSSTLLTYDGGTQTNDGAARTLYIDPSSLSTSGDLENIILTIDNAASSSGTVLNLGPTNALPVNPVTSIAVENSSSSVFTIGPSSHVSGTTTPQSGSSNQDILAEALANTQVFQSDSVIQDSLTVVNSNQTTVMTPRLLEPSSLLTSSPSTLRQATMLLPSLTTVLPPPNPAGVLETSLTLNQPIMTPLEVPSSAIPTLQAPPPIPSSLELPLTITQPVLSATSQSYASLPVNMSSHLSKRNAAESTVSGSNLPLTISEPSSVSAENFNPSMPLLSEEIDSQNETDANPSLVSPSSHLTDEPHNHSDSSYNEYSESKSNMCETASSHVEDLSPFSEASENVPHDKEISLNDSETPVSLNHQVRYPQASENTSEIPKDQSSEDLLSEDRSSENQNISHSSDQLVEDPVPNNVNVLSSSSDPVYFNSSVKETSESTGNSISDTNHSSPCRLASDPSFDHSSYSQLPESSSQLACPPTVTSFIEIPVTASSIPKDIINTKLEMHHQKFDACTSENRSKNTSDQFHNNEQSVIADENVHASCLQIPDSRTSYDEDDKMITGKFSGGILKSSQSPSNSHSQTSCCETPERTLEVDVNVKKEEHVESPGSFDAYPEVPIGATQDDENTTDVALQQPPIDISHSMPMLIEEPTTETTSNFTSPDSVMQVQSLMKSDESPANNMEITKEYNIEHSERSKDQGSLSPKSVPCPDLYDERIDSDDELPSIFTPHSSQQDDKKKSYSKDDIVWVRSNKMYWPAVITNVAKKNRKVYIRLVNSPRKNKAFKIGFRNIIDFKDKERNKQFLELGKKFCTDIESAYDKVKEFRVKKCLRNKLDAVRYLTFDPDDKFYGKTSDPTLYENFNINENEEKNEENLEDDMKSISSSTSDEITDFEKACPHSVISEDFSSSSNSEKEIEEKKEYAYKLLQVIKSEDCWNHLCQIYHGEVPSDQHKIFYSGTLKMRSDLKYSTGLTIFPPSGDLELELAEILHDYIKKLRIVEDWSDYMYYVLMPEALCYALRKVHDITDNEAKDLFFKLSEQKPQ